MLYSLRMAFDKKYWREDLPLLIQGYGGYCAVRVSTYWSQEGGGEYLIRRVMRTDEGYGIFDVYLDSKGNSPIISGTSSTSDFDIDMPATSKAVSLPYENIADRRRAGIVRDAGARRFCAGCRSSLCALAQSACPKDRTVVSKNHGGRKVRARTAAGSDPSGSLVANIRRGTHRSSRKPDKTMAVFCRSCRNAAGQRHGERLGLHAERCDSTGSEDTEGMGSRRVLHICNPRRPLEFHSWTTAPDHPALEERRSV
jgi:hypothetical protein